MDTVHLGIFFKKKKEIFSILLRHPHANRKSFLEARASNRKFIKWADVAFPDHKKGFERHRLRRADCEKVRYHRAKWWGFKRYVPSTYDRFYMVHGLSKNDLMIIKLAWHLEKWRG